MIVLEWLFLTIAPCDAAEPWQLGSQDAATPMMQGIIDLHHDIFFFLILILVFVSWILVRTLWHFHYKKNPIPQRIVHGTTIEILWTIFPSIIPMFIAIPSFALLYSMDEVVVDPAITIKAIGHQWYWTYEYSDYNSSDEQSLTFDSYTIPEDDPELGQSRLLEVDNRVVVPAKTHLRIIVTSADVPHSWAVPSLGVKCDAVPGRLNQTSILVQREGVYYGQCSEICGTNHAFMPIVVEAVDRKDYANRVENLFITKTGGVSWLQHFITIAYCDGRNWTPPVTPPSLAGQEPVTPPDSPLMESSSSSESLNTFRNLITANHEADLFRRIAFLENQHLFGLPVQTRPGEYAEIVLGRFNGAVNVQHYQWLLDYFNFHLQVDERKGLLQDRLHTLLLEEPNLAQILRVSPYTDIRRGAFDFLENSTESLNALRHAFQRDLMDGLLNSYMDDLNRRGRNADVYQGFYRYFINEDFRRFHNLPLP